MYRRLVAATGLALAMLVGCASDAPGPGATSGPHDADVPGIDGLPTASDDGPPVDRADSDTRMDTQTAVDEPDVDGPQGSPEILVSVNGLPIASESTVWFNTATRQPVRKTVSVTNHGNAPLGISSIH